MPFAPGNIEAGSFPAIRTLPQKPDQSSIFTNVYGRAAPLGADDYVICADEKTSIEARRRKQPTLPPAPNRPTYVEHEYFRAWVPGPIWQPGMSIEQMSSAAVKSKV